MNWKSIAFTGATALLCTTGLTLPASAQLDYEEIATNLASPLYLCSPPGDTDRLFICEQNTARIRIIKNGTLLGTPFIDLGSIAGQNGERGLLGMAFHPNYAGPGTGEGKFYVNYTNNSGDTVVREYEVSANPDIADAGTFTNIITVNQPFSNHNGGCLQFGPDGMLYIGMGDGGSANDPGNRSQDLTNQLLGKMLRLDVDIAAPHIPGDNPFVGITGDDEIWSYGLRNPWRFSFDRLTGDMWIGDVGQGSREEVHFEPAATGGLNYGWRCMEGSLCTGMSGCTCNVGVELPVDEYNHGLGCSITGGYRYRGTEMPGFYGKYFYADYCSDRVWSIDFDGVNISNKIEHEAELGLPGGVSITSFGEDANGELYIVDANGGQIYKLQEECTGDATNYCVGETNSSGTGALMDTFGSLSISANNFNLTCDQAVPNVTGLFFFGPNQIQIPFGDGFQCVGGGITRMPPVAITDLFGSTQKLVDFTSPPANALTAGTDWNFQYWYRDTMAGMSGFNTSDGLKVTFCP